MPNLWFWGRTAANLSRRELLLEGEVPPAPRLAAIGVEDNIAAASVDLTSDEMDAIDAVSALAPEYPGWMFARQGEVRRRQLAGGEPRPNAR